jgi:hypothetical protein
MPMSSPFTHEIWYRDKRGVQPVATVDLPMAVEFNEQPFEHHKQILTDTWVLHVGAVLGALLDDAAARCAPKPGYRLVIFGLEVVNFDKGVLIFSPNTLHIRFHYEVWRGETPVANGSVSGSGTAKATDVGTISTFIPFLNIRNYDQSIELAMSRSLQACMASLAQQVQRL